MDFLKKHFYLIIFVIALVIRLTATIQHTLKNPMLNHFQRVYVYDQNRLIEMAWMFYRGDLLALSYPNLRNPSFKGKKLFYYGPGYPFLIALVLIVFGKSIFIFRIFQNILGSFTVILIGKAAEGIFNKLTGIIASLIACFYGPLILYDMLILRASFLAFLNILLLFLLIKYTKTLKLKYMILGFLVLSYSIVTRPLNLILLPFLLGWLGGLLQSKNLSIKKIIFNLIIALIVTFVFIAPVTLRNILVAKKFVLISSQGTDVFWMGNAPDSIGVDRYLSIMYRRLNRESKGSMVRALSIFLKQLYKHPLNYVKLYWRKIRMLLNGYEVPHNVNYYLFKRYFKTILSYKFIDFSIISPLFLIGIFIFIRKVKKELLLLYLLTLASSLGILIFHIQARYRIPVIPYYIIFAAGTIVYFIELIKKLVKKEDFIKNLAKTGSILIAFVVLLIFVKPDPSYGGVFRRIDKIRNEDKLNYISAYIYQIKKFAPGSPERLKMLKKIYPVMESVLTYYPGKVELWYYYAATSYYLGKLDNEDRALKQLAKISPEAYNDYMEKKYAREKEKP